MPFGARKNLGLILGIILFIFGLFGILSGINVTNFQIPVTINILAWILAFGSIYLIFESFTELGMKRTLAFLVAFIALIASLIPILNQLGFIGFSMPLGLLFYHIILTIEGLFLVINAFGT